MKYTKKNIRNVDISALVNYRILIVSESNRRGSGKLFNGKPNCSGYNINKFLRNDMTVGQYQATIRNNFSPNDPQFSLVKHLKSDVMNGYVELVQ